MAKPSGDRKGRRAEHAAELLLRLKGYRILARRFRCGLGEVDLIARRFSVIAFIEVKYRPSHEAAIEAIGARQRLRIQAAASAFLANHPQTANLDCRFDVVLVGPTLLPRHIVNAWSA